MNELSQREIFASRLLHHRRGEVFVRETEGASEGVFDEGFGEAAGEGVGLCGDEVAQLEVVFEGGAVVEGGGARSGPSFFDSALFKVVLGAPFAGGVEVFEAEADGVDLAVAARALSCLCLG